MLSNNGGIGTCAMTNLLAFIITEKNSPDLDTTVLEQMYTLLNFMLTYNTTANHLASLTVSSYAMPYGLILMMGVDVFRTENRPNAKLVIDGYGTTHAMR